MLTWPNEDDQMNMTKFCEHDRNFHNHDRKLFELHRKNNKYCHKDEHIRVNMTESWNNNKNSHNDEHIRVNMTENQDNNDFRSYSIGHVSHCGIIFNIFNFQSNSFVFGHVQQVNVCRCQFSVNFNQMRFVGFGQIQPQLSVISIRSC